MTKLERLHETIDAIIKGNLDARMRRHAYVHLYGVAQSCMLLAHRRGLNPELSAMMGMLHDRDSYPFQRPRATRNRAPCWRGRCCLP